ncbi:MAG: restriction endonuclease subunit S [Flavobacterium sp.]|nr:restriction endonuclease subunit S [Flavobacterium sp.]
MTTAEKYRQLEKSPVINIARFIFNDLKNEATNTTLGKVIADIKTGKTPSKQEKRYYEDDSFDWFKPNEIGSEKYLFKAKDKVSKYAFESKQATIYEADTILINAIGDVGRISILKKQASSNQQITGIRLKEDVFVDYAYFYLLAHREYFYVDLFQTTLPIVNQKKINTIPFCYPIIEDQKRIVKGFEEIEKIKTIADLQIIDNLNWKEEYKSICRNFFNLQFGTKKIINELTHQLDLIKQLRQAFLREAMQGKLVKSTKTKETGQQLLTKIKAEKAQLIAEKILKKEKELAPITEDEIPFEIPEHWVWCRLGEITYITSGSTPSQDSFVEKGIPYIKMYNLRNQKIDFFHKPQYIKEEVHNGQLKRCRAYTGDVIMNIVGPPLGKIAIIPESLPECNFNQAAVLIRPLIKSMNYFIFWYLNEMSEINSIDTKGVAGQANISVTQSHNIKIPIPPLHEQEQIVEKLEELMAFCDGLEQSIKESQGYNERLLQQVLREALQPKEEVKVISLENRKLALPLKTVLGAHIVDVCNTIDFGRVKFQKLLFLTEYYCKIDFESHYVQKAAGPHDDALIKSIENEFKRQRFFEVKQENSDTNRVRYTKLPNASQINSMFLENFGGEAINVNNLLMRLRAFSWVECEVIATIYAVWNNRLIKGQTITDESLFEDFMAWSSRKSNFSKDFYKKLLWMREENIVPNGWGKYVDKPEKKMA